MQKRPWLEMSASLRLPPTNYPVAFNGVNSVVQVHEKRRERRGSFDELLLVR
jgi:hypothetical protein